MLEQPLPVPVSDVQNTLRLPLNIKNTIFIKSTKPSPAAPLSLSLPSVPLSLRFCAFNTTRTQRGESRGESGRREGRERISEETKERGRKGWQERERVKKRGRERENE